MDKIRMALAALLTLTLGGCLAIQSVTMDEGDGERWLICDDAGWLAPHEGHTLCVQLEGSDGGWFELVCIEGGDGPEPS